MKHKEHHHHTPPKTVIPFILVFLLGLFIVIFFHPQIWFDPLSDYLTGKLTQKLNADLTIHRVYGNFNQGVTVDSLTLRNKEERFTFTADRISVNYRNILVLLVTRSVDSLEIMNPVLVTRKSQNKGPENTMKNEVTVGKIETALNKIPAVKIRSMFLENGAYLQAEEGKEERIAEQISGTFSLNTRGGKADVSAQSLTFHLPGNGWETDSLAFDVSYANGLLKVRDFLLCFNKANFHLTGKIQPVPDLPFKGEVLVQNITPPLIRQFSSAPWTEIINRGSGNVFDLLLTFSGNRQSVRTDFSIQGIFMDEIIDQCEGQLRYRTGRVEMNRLSFQNAWGKAFISKASYEDGRFSLDADLDQVNIPLEDSPFSPFTVHGSFATGGRLPDSVAVQYHFSGNLGNRLPVDDLAGRFLYQDNHLMLTDTNRVRIPGAMLDITGRVDSLKDLNIMFSGKLSGFHLKEVLPESLTVDNGTLQGRLKGVLQDPDLSFIYLLNQAQYGSHTLARARGAASVKQLQTALSGNFYVDFSELNLRDYRFDGGGAFLEFLQDTILISSLHLSAGENRMELVGKAGMDSLVMIDEFAANIQDNSFYLIEPFQFDFKTGKVRITPLSLRFNEGVFHAQGESDLKNEIHFNASGENLNLSELFSLWDSPMQTEGIMNFSVDASGALSNPEIQAQWGVEDFHVEDYAFQSFSATAQLADSVLTLNKARFQQGEKSYLNAFGRFPVILTLDQSPGIRLPREESFTFTTEIHQTALDVLTELSPRIQHIGGISDGILTGRGTYQDPEINLNLTIEDFTLNQFGFKKVLSQLNYQDEKILIKNINIRSEDGEYQVTGSYPFHVYGFGDSVVTSEALEDSVFILVEGKDRQLAYLTPVIRAIENSEGTFTTRLTLSGPVSNPVKNGLLTIEDATLTLANVLNPVRDVDGTFTIENDTVTVDVKGSMEKSEPRFFRLGRNSGRNKNLSLTGTIDLDDIFHPVLNLRAQGNNAHIRSLNDRIDIVGEGDIRVTGRDTVRAVGLYATQEGLLNFDFKRPLKKQEPRDKKRQFEYILEILIDKNVFLRNELVDAELEGNVVLEKRAGEYQTLAGNLSIRSGKFYYYSAIFDIESGEIIFDPYAGNITLDFVASTQVMDGSNRIIATLSGDIDKPVIELRDERNMFTSQAEIIQLLTTGRVGNGQIVTGTAQTYLETIFEKELERTASEWGGFERVDLKTRGPLFENPNLDSVSILLERRIGKDLYLSYEQSLNNEKANRNVELEYRLNRNFSIIGEADDESVSFSYRIRFQY